MQFIRDLVSFPKTVVLRNLSLIHILDAAVIEDVLNGREGVSIANYNCPGQIVITGEAAAVAEAGTALKEAGARRVLPLKVSGPFHSPMMRPQEKSWRRFLPESA